MTETESLIEKLRAASQPVAEGERIITLGLAESVIRRHEAELYQVVHPTLQAAEAIAIIHRQEAERLHAQSVNISPERVQRIENFVPNEPRPELVERVAKAIENAIFWNGTVMCTSAEDLAKTAIAAMRCGQITAMKGLSIKISGVLDEYASEPNLYSIGDATKDILALIEGQS